MFNIDNVIIEVALWVCDHTHATDNFICCTDMIGAFDSLFYRLKHPTPDMTPEQIEKEIKNALINCEGYDDYMNIAEQFIGYDAAEEVCVMFEDEDENVDEFLREKVRQSINDRERQEKTLDDKYFSLVGDRQNAIDILDTACQINGFKSAVEMGNKNYEGSVNVAKLENALTERYKNESWFV